MTHEAIIQASNELTESLRARRLILDEELRQELVKLGLDELMRPTIFFEDLLNIIFRNLPKHQYISLCGDWSNNSTVSIKHDRLSETDIYEADSFVNATAKLLISAISKGFISYTAEQTIKNGLQLSNYKARSQLLHERNWILETFKNFKNLL